jgi:hypothetical protein
MSGLVKFTDIQKVVGKQVAGDRAVRVIGLGGSQVHARDQVYA